MAHQIKTYSRPTTESETQNVKSEHSCCQGPSCYPASLYKEDNLVLHGPTCTRSSKQTSDTESIWMYNTCSDIETLGSTLYGTSQGLLN